MIAKWRGILGQLGQQMWVRSTLFAVLGIFTALVAVKLDPFIPVEVSASIGADAVFQVLNILASSMLAVTTFSLSVMVTSLGAATSNATPRATRLLVRDPTSQNVLSIFLGTFLYSLVGIVALNTGYYSDRGRFILFVVAIGVIGVVVFAILRWIDHLSHLGRVGDTTKRVEDATAEAISIHVATPYLGGAHLTPDMLEDAGDSERVFPDTTGYIAYIDMNSLQETASEHGVDIYLLALPGTFADPALPLAALKPNAAGRGKDKQTLEKAIRNAFTIGTERSFNQDPRFGLCVLAEIASRALSPGINDPGTAIDVIGRGIRLLHPLLAPGRERDSKDIACTNVFAPRIAAEDAFSDFFTPIARDGAAIVEVQIRLQKALLALCEMGDAEARHAAKQQSKEALARAEGALTLEADKQRLRDIAQRVAEL